MQSLERQTSMVDADADSGSSSSNRSHRVQFIPARDSRNRRIPGLYQRNGRYYAQLWIDKGDGTKTARKMPLLDDADKPITTLVAARDALDVKRHHLLQPQHRLLDSQQGGIQLGRISFENGFGGGGHLLSAGVSNGRTSWELERTGCLTGL